MTNEPSNQLISAEELNSIAHAMQTLLGGQYAAPVQIADLRQISEAERRNLLLRLMLVNPPSGLPDSPTASL